MCVFFLSGWILLTIVLRVQCLRPLRCAPELAQVLRPPRALCPTAALATARVPRVRQLAVEPPPPSGPSRAAADREREMGQEGPSWPRTPPPPAGQQLQMCLRKRSPRTSCIQHKAPSPPNVSSAGLQLPEQFPSAPSCVNTESPAAPRGWAFCAGLRAA